MTSKANILVVDDEPQIADMISSALQLYGYSVQTAMDGGEGVAKVGGNKYDLAIMDIQMPGMDGITALGEMKKVDVIVRPDRIGDDEYWRVEVRDQGKGIPEKDLEQVFESFYQVEDYSTRTQDGLGLGLTIARKIIELYQGTIGISSRPDMGTTVSVTLPRPS